MTRRMIVALVVLIVLGMVAWRAYEATRTRQIWEERGIRLQFRMQGKGVDYSWVAHGQSDGTATFEATMVAGVPQRQTGTLSFEAWTKLLDDTNRAFERMSHARADGPAFKPTVTFLMSLESDKRRQQQMARNDPQATPLLEELDRSVVMDPYRSWTK